MVPGLHRIRDVCIRVCPSFVHVQREDVFMSDANSNRHPFPPCRIRPPFLADTQAELDAKIRLGRVPSLPAQYSQELGLIVRSMLQVNVRLGYCLNQLTVCSLSLIMSPHSPLFPTSPGKDRLQRIYLPTPGYDLLAESWN